MTLQKAAPVADKTTGGSTNTTLSSRQPQYSTTGLPAQVRTLATPLYVPAELERAPWVCWRYDVDMNLSLIHI